MRTTLNINDDILGQLKLEAAKDNDRSFKEVVNEALRMGLRALSDLPTRKPLTIRSRKMGTFPGLNYDNIEEMLDQVEGIDRKW